MSHLATSYPPLQHLWPFQIWGLNPKRPCFCRQGLLALEWLAWGDKVYCPLLKPVFTGRFHVILFVFLILFHCIHFNFIAFILVLLISYLISPPRKTLEDEGCCVFTFGNANRSATTLTTLTVYLRKTWRIIEIAIQIRLKSAIKLKGGNKSSTHQNQKTVTYLKAENNKTHFFTKQTNETRDWSLKVTFTGQTLISVAAGPYPRVNTHIKSPLRLKV